MYILYINISESLKLRCERCRPGVSNFSLKLNSSQKLKSDI